MRVWKKIIRDSFFFIVLVGTIIGVYYLSYNQEERFLQISYALAYGFGFLILYAILLYLYWFIRRKRTERSPRKIKEVILIREKDLVSKEEKLIRDVIKPQIQELSTLNVKEITEDNPRLSFEFAEESLYNFLHNIAIKVLSSVEITISALLRVEYPIAISIKRKTKEEEKSEEKTSINSSKFFTFHSSHQLLYEEILNKEGIDLTLINVKDTLVNLSLNGKFVNVTINKPENIGSYFLLISMIHDEIMLKDFGDSQVEKLTCYECGDIFKSNEEKCDKCGTPRPTCAVCLLDLKPSEKKDVIRTPCCEVFAHKKHIITWLESNSTCPNCKKDLYLWLRKLKQEEKSEKEAL